MKLIKRKQSEFLFVKPSLTVCLFLSVLILIETLRCGILIVSAGCVTSISDGLGSLLAHKPFCHLSLSLSHSFLNLIRSGQNKPKTNLDCVYSLLWIPTQIKWNIPAAEGPSCGALRSLQTLTVVSLSRLKAVCVYTGGFLFRCFALMGVSRTQPLGTLWGQIGEW